MAKAEGLAGGKGWQARVNAGRAVKACSPSRVRNGVRRVSCKGSVPGKGFHQQNGRPQAHAPMFSISNSHHMHRLQLSLAPTGQALHPHQVRIDGVRPTGREPVPCCLIPGILAGFSKLANAVSWLDLQLTQSACHGLPVCSVSPDAPIATSSVDQCMPVSFPVTLQVM